MARAMNQPATPVAPQGGVREAFEEAYQVMSLWFKYFNSDKRPIEKWTEVCERVNAWLPKARDIRQALAHAPSATKEDEEDELPWPAQPTVEPIPATMGPVEERPPFHLEDDEIDPTATVLVDITETLVTQNDKNLLVDKVRTAFVLGDRVRVLVTGPVEGEKGRP